MIITDIRDLAWRDFYEILFWIVQYNAACVDFDHVQWFWVILSHFGIYWSFEKMMTMTTVTDSWCLRWPLIRRGLLTPYGDIKLVDIGKCNGFSPDGLKRLPEAMMTYMSSDIHLRAILRDTRTLAINHRNQLENYQSKFAVKSSRGQLTKRHEIWF